MSDQPPTSDSDQPAKHQRPKRRWLKSLLIALPVLLILGAWAGLLFSAKHVDTSDSATVALQFVKDIRDNQPHSAYRLTSPAYQREASFDHFNAAVVQAYLEQWPHSQPSIVDQQYNKKNPSQRRTAVNLPKDDSGDGFQIALQLTKQGNAWLVESYSISRD
jgi:hypothetical protein